MFFLTRKLSKYIIVIHNSDIKIHLLNILLPTINAIFFLRYVSIVGLQRQGKYWRTNQVSEALASCGNMGIQNKAETY